MDTTNIAPLKAVLKHKLLVQHGGLCAEPLTKASFPHELWGALASFIQQNRSNSLIQSAIINLRHGGLIPRSFLILSVLYGSYSYQPSKARILKDLVNMLDEDLEEKELRVCEYAEGKVNTFFPELGVVWKNIREVYGAAEFSLDVLPHTPYHAYSLFVLNRPRSLDGNVRHAALFEDLSVLHHQMQTVSNYANPETKPHLTIVK